MTFSITIPPRINRHFEGACRHKRWIWDNTGNCYSYVIADENLKAINLGSLSLQHNCNADNNKLDSADGLQELLERDGWEIVEKNDVDAEKMHVIAMFGFHPIGSDFKEFHCFRLNSCGAFSEKLGRGKHIRSGLYFDPRKPITLDNITYEYNKSIANSVQPPVFAGFHRIPLQGLKVHPEHFKRGTPELMKFYPYYS